MAMDWESWDSRECSLLVSMAMVWVGGKFWSLRMRLVRFLMPCLLQREIGRPMEEQKDWISFLQVSHS